MTNEGSRLLSQAENGYGTTGSADIHSTDRSTVADHDLVVDSQHLLSWARRTDNPSNTSEGIASLHDEDYYLAVMLYAMYLNQKDTAPLPSKRSGRARERVTRAQSVQRAHHLLYRLVNELLDRDSRSVRPLETDGTAEENELGVHASHTEEEENVEDGLWRKWLLGDKKLSGKLEHPSFDCRGTC